MNASDPDWLSLNVYDIIYNSGVNLLPYIPDSYDLKEFLEAYDIYDPLTATNDQKQYLFGFLDSIYIDTLEVDLPMVHNELYMFDSYFNNFTLWRLNISQLMMINFLPSVIKMFVILPAILPVIVVLLPSSATQYPDSLMFRSCLD